MVSCLRTVSVSVKRAIRPRALVGPCSGPLPAGMTNAGKTYSITGPEDNPGLLPRTLAETFRNVADAGRAAASRGVGGEDLVVVVSYLEIYNEQVGMVVSARLGVAGE
jgi:hypothetical protein